MIETRWTYRDGSTEDADEALKNLAPSGPSGAARKLYLSFNKMTSLPQSVTLLRNLEELYLNGNEIAELPAFVTQLTTLKVLDCSNNRLSSVPPDLSRLVNLEGLELANNSLSSLPGSLVNLTNLRSIYLKRNKQLPQHLQQFIFNDHTATQSLLHQIALYQFQPLAARATFQWLLIWKHHLWRPEGMWCIPRDVANIIAHMIYDSRASPVWERVVNSK